MTRTDHDGQSFLPLQPATFPILIAVADDDRHGYAIIQDIAARTNGALKLSPAYRSIQRMLEQGLLVDPQDPGAADRLLAHGVVARELPGLEGRRQVGRAFGRILRAVDEPARERRAGALRVDAITAIRAE